MTPEQMREAAAKIVRDRGYFGIATLIEDIPLTPPEPTMKDRIAKVIYGDENVRTSKAAFQAALEDAGKVLEAMREPTEAMVAAGINARVSNMRNRSADQMIDIYRAMIDAALDENVRPRTTRSTPTPRNG